jgi:hypothetical protein
MVPLIGIYLETGRSKGICYNALDLRTKNVSLEIYT